VAQNEQGEEVTAVYILTKPEFIEGGLHFNVALVEGSKDTITGELTNLTLFIDGCNGPC